MDQNSQNSNQNPAEQGGQKMSAQAAQKLQQYQNAVISNEVQQELNKPLAAAGVIDPRDLEFLQTVMEKVDKGDINLYRPATLLNIPVYEKLSEEARGKADFDAVNLLATIRDIRRLWNMGDRETYQMQNLTHRIRLTKERLEQLGGDIFII